MAASPLSPLAIANYFVSKSMDTGIELTPMKLVKLVYISHGWYLGLTDNPLLSESIQAWKYGPVVPSVYRTFKKYGNEQITSMESESQGFSFVVPLVNDEEITAFLDKIWDVYKEYDGVQLSTITHQKGTPWDIVWNQHGGKHRSSAIIPNDIIKQHYVSKVKLEPATATN